MMADTLMQLESFEMFDLGLLAAISKILELIVVVCVRPGFHLDFLHGRHVLMLLAFVCPMLAPARQPPSRPSPSPTPIPQKA